MENVFYFFGQQWNTLNYKHTPPPPPTKEICVQPTEEDGKMHLSNRKMY